MVEFSILMLLGIVMLIGFIASVLFKRTKIPEVLFLILVGIILGPVLGIIDPHAVQGYAVVISAFMLVVIMLDNGLSFDIFKVTKFLPVIIVFGICVVALSAMTIAAVLMHFLGMQLIPALILALCMSGTTTDVITILTSKMKISASARQLLVFESVINDVQIIPFFILLKLAQTSAFDSTTLYYLFLMPIAVCIGAIAAFAWIHLIGTKLGRHPLNYVATLGILFILYSFIQGIGGSGPVAVLTFSLVMGNALNLFDYFKLNSRKFDFGVLKSFKEVEADVSFFVKTLFFVFLGIIFSFEALKSELVVLSLAILGVILISRALLLSALSSKLPEYRQSFGAMVWVCPRGYVAAVLAFAAAGSGIFGHDVVNIVLMNIFLTTFIAIGYSIYNGRTGQKSVIEKKRK